MDPIRIFYSWQSDRDRDVCSRFIQLALQAALDTIQPGFQPPLILDSDTMGVAGTPPVSETILRKIRECDIFIGDVSFVGMTPGGKLLPNPNVMTEFGYARSVLEDGQILLVMNTGFGAERDLPFDLAHLRHPLAYALPEGAPDGERRRRRVAFADKLKTPIEASLRFVLSQRSSKTDATEVPMPSFELIGQLDQLQARGDVPAIVEGPRLVFRMASAVAARQPYLEPAKIKAARLLFIPDGYSRGQEITGPNQWSTFDPPIRRGGAPNPEARWYTRLVRPGILEMVIMVGARIDDDPTIMVEGFPLEARIIETARCFAKIFAQIGQDGPLAISVSLLGLENVQLTMPRWVSRPLRMPSLFLGDITAASSAAVTPQQFRPLFDALWLGCGFDEGSTSIRTASGKVMAQNEPSNRLRLPAGLGVPGDRTSNSFPSA
jgi:hypothetical protein